MNDLEKTSYIMGYTDGVIECPSCKDVKDYIRNINHERRSLIEGFDKVLPINKNRYEQIQSQLLIFEELGFKIGIHE